MTGTVNIKSSSDSSERVSTIEEDRAVLWEEYHSSQAGPRSGNTSGWNNPEVDSILTEMRGVFDPQKRVELSHDIVQTARATGISLGD